MPDLDSAALARASANTGPACHTRAPVPMPETAAAPGCDTRRSSEPRLTSMNASSEPLMSVVHSASGSPSSEKLSIMVAPSDESASLWTDGLLLRPACDSRRPRGSGLLTRHRPQVRRVTHTRIQKLLGGGV
eukprot:5461013-Prymnesium_polylepis.1